MPFKNKVKSQKYQKQYQRVWRKKNKNKVLKQSKKYYQKNKDKIKKWQKKYQKTKEYKINHIKLHKTSKYKKYQKNYRFNNKLKIKKDAINYRLKHKIRLKKQAKKRYSEYVRRIKELKSNGCSICGYNNAQSALHFHHVNNKKKFLINIECSKIRTNSEIKTELYKCMLLCANCHCEIHEKEKRSVFK